MMGKDDKTKNDPNWPFIKKQEEKKKEEIKETKIEETTYVNILE